MSIKGLIIYSILLIGGVLLIFYKGEKSGEIKAKLEELKKKVIHDENTKKIRKRNSSISRDGLLSWLRSKR